MSTVSPLCERGGTLHCWVTVSWTLVSNTIGLSVSIELESRELEEVENDSTCWTWTCLTEGSSWWILKFFVGTFSLSSNIDGMLANGFREEGKELTNDLVELPEFSSQKIGKAAFSAWNNLCEYLDSIKSCNIKINSYQKTPETNGGEDLRPTVLG